MLEIVFGVDLDGVIGLQKGVADGKFNAAADLGSAVVNCHDRFLQYKPKLRKIGR